MKRPLFSTPLATWLLSLPRPFKRLIVITNDVVLLYLALWASFSLRLGVFFVPVGINQWISIFIAPAIIVMGLYFSGAYKRINRYIGRTGAKRTLTGLIIGIFVWASTVYFSGLDIVAASGMPRSIPLLYLALSFLFIWSNREFASWFLTRNQDHNWRNEFQAGNGTSIKKILIWGYSDLALRLANNLQLTAGYDLIGIIDEDKSLHFLKADNINIYPPDYLDNLIARKQVNEIFIDNKIVPKNRKMEIINSLNNHSVDLKVLPSMDDITSGIISVDEAKKIRVEDLLGRELIPPHEDLLKGSVEGKSIMVTGAGGSIGSELVRQLIKLKPIKLVLFEMSEAALYLIQEESERLINGSDRPKIEAIVGNVIKEHDVAHVIKKHNIQTIYHAAAYKHVPIVEHNPIIGLENNSFGTLSIARAANANGVERFILISTDKAVRPTNIMGASKRLAEMILQAESAEPDCQTKFGIVRFGNVLGSSGSVVPKFRQQISDSEAVTVTHPDITRYFMLTSEAVELVIQAGTLAEKGSVFMLDMGKPVKIADLARTMISLAGKSIRDANNPEGDISIEYTNLRSGEKLYEELSIDKSMSATIHERIQKLDEPFTAKNLLEPKLARLEKCMQNRDMPGIANALSDLVEGYEYKPQIQ